MTINTTWQLVLLLYEKQGQECLEIEIERQKISLQQSACDNLAPESVTQESIWWEWTMQSVPIFSNTIRHKIKGKRSMLRKKKKTHRDQEKGIF